MTIIEQAFPMHERDDALKGMTLRQRYAGMAMQGLLLSDAGREAQYLAENAVEFADALIAELSREKSS